MDVVTLTNGTLVSAHAKNIVNTTSPGRAFLVSSRDVVAVQRLTVTATIKQLIKRFL